MHSFSAQLWNGYEAIRVDMQEDDVADTLEGAEERIQRFRRQRFGIVESFIDCQKESKNLLHHLRLLNTFVLLIIFTIFRAL